MEIIIVTTYRYLKIYDELFGGFSNYKYDDITIK